jgi:hypothetical protein
VDSQPLLPTATRWLRAPWVDRHFTRRGWIAACAGLDALLYAVLALPAAAMAPAGLLALALWPQPQVWAVAVTVFVGAFLATPGFILMPRGWRGRRAAPPAPSLPCGNPCISSPATCSPGCWPVRWRR